MSKRKSTRLLTKSGKRLIGAIAILISFLMLNLMTACSTVVYSSECLWYIRPQDMSEEAKNTLTIENKRIIVKNKTNYDDNCF